MNFYKHFIGDYQRDTMRLSMMEDGAYRRLLDEYYATEKPLPLDQDECYRAARAITAQERAAVDKIIERYFVRLDDGYHHNRIDSEIANASAYADAQRMRAHKRWDKPNESRDDASHSHSQTPDSTARSQRHDLPPADAGGGDGKPPPCPFDALIKLFHETLPALPRCKVMTETRRAHMRARWREYPSLEEWREFFRRVSVSPFLMGKVSSKDRRPFKCTLDWLVKPENFAKVLEGKYAE